MVKLIFIIFFTLSMFPNIQVEKDLAFELYKVKFKERMVFIINKEYSLTSLDEILVGIVNYPQWFVTVSTGLYGGLTFHDTIKGSESLYPTNITQERWMFNFNLHTNSEITYCSNITKNWADSRMLELVMYSQAVNVCLSTDFDKLQDNLIWYEKCWKGYHSSCRLKRM